MQSVKKEKSSKTLATERIEQPSTEIGKVKDKMHSGWMRQWTKISEDPFGHHKLEMSINYSKTNSSGQPNS